MEETQIYIIGLDLETLGLNAKPKNSVGQTVEVMFSQKTGALYEKKFQVAGAVLAQIYCKKYTFDGESQGPVSSVLLNVQPYTKDLSTEAIAYAKEHDTWELKDSIPIQDAITKFLDFIPKAGKVIFVAHNGYKFDFAVIALHLERHGRSLPEGPTYMMFDSLYALKKKLPGRKSYSLGKIYKDIFGKSLENAHTADADTNAMFELLERSYGSKNEMLKGITLGAKPWKPDISFSLYGLCTENAKGEKEYLSKKAICALEAAGWTTRASLTQAFQKGTDIATLDPPDLEIIKGYCTYRIAIMKEEKKQEETIVQALGEMSLGDQISKRAIKNRAKKLSDKENVEKVKVPGCGKGFIDLFLKKRGHTPTVEDLIKIAHDTKGDPLAFRKAILEIAPTMNKDWSDKILKWMTTDE